MKTALDQMKWEINLWFESLSESDIVNIEEGKPFHIMITDQENSDILRAVIFLEKHNSGDI